MYPQNGNPNMTTAMRTYRRKRYYRRGTKKSWYHKIPWGSLASKAWEYRKHIPYWPNWLANRPVNSPPSKNYSSRLVPAAVNLSKMKSVTTQSVQRPLEMEPSNTLPSRQLVQALRALTVLTTLSPEKSLPSKLMSSEPIQELQSQPIIPQQSISSVGEIRSQQQSELRQQHFQPVQTPQTPIQTCSSVLRKRQ